LSTGNNQEQTPASTEHSAGFQTTMADRISVAISKTLTTALEQQTKSFAEALAQHTRTITQAFTVGFQPQAANLSQNQIVLDHMFSQVNTKTAPPNVYRNRSNN